MRFVVCTFVALSAAAPAVQAQERGLKPALQRVFEMPAHRSLVGVVSEPEVVLAPFETDGCSGGMSWSWRVVADIFPNFETALGAHPPWETCCVAHDRLYHDAAGATEAEASFLARLEADEALRDCVANPPPQDIETLSMRYDVPEDRVRSAFGLIATSMFDAVRFGGGPCTVLPWRWGFGYPECLPGF